jgi:hypothetical protein
MKGFTRDFMPNKDFFHLVPMDAPTDAKPIVISVRELKAVFFVKDFKGDSQYQDNKTIDPHKPVIGRKIKVTFKDGEHMVGTTQGYQPGRPGFFIFSSDPRSNSDPFRDPRRQLFLLIRHSRLPHYGITEALFVFPYTASSFTSARIASWIPLYLPLMSQSSRNHAPTSIAMRMITFRMFRKPRLFSRSCESDRVWLSFFIATSQVAPPQGQVFNVYIAAGTLHLYASTITMLIPSDISIPR